MDQAEEAVSVEERMMSILAAEEGQEDISDVEAPVETESAEVDSVEEETTEPVKLKLKRGDEEVEVEYSEAVELAQKGYDYTKKTQELAEQRRQTEMYAQALRAQEQTIRQQAELQGAFIKDIGKVEALSEQIAQFEGLDWSSLTDTDPVQAQKLWISYQQLQTKRTQGQQEIQQKAAYLQQQRNQQDEMRLGQARAELLRVMPDFNSDKASWIKESSRSYGFTDDELSTVSDPRMVLVLADAAAYRKLQNEKADITKKVTGKPPVVKPGTKDQKTAGRASVAQAKQELRKTGNPDLAAALIEKML